jgi:hypothetical protein
VQWHGGQVKQRNKASENAFRIAALNVQPGMEVHQNLPNVQHATGRSNQGFAAFEPFEPFGISEPLQLNAGDLTKDSRFSS